MTLPVSELIDGITAFSAGDSLETVLERTRHHGAAYESTRDWDLSEELQRLNLLVQERRAANLSAVKDAALNIISPATNKLYDRISKRPETSSPAIGNNASQKISARVVLEVILRSMAERNIAWDEIQEKYRILSMEAGRDLQQMLTPIRHASVSACQEKWLKIIASRSCEREVANESRTAQLDSIIDECLQLAEARRILIIVLDYLFAEYDEHLLAEEVTGFPSANTRDDLNRLTKAAEDLRRVELQQGVWRLMNLGHHIPRRDLRFLLAGNLNSWSAR